MIPPEKTAAASNWTLWLLVLLTKSLPVVAKVLCPMGDFLPQVDQP